MMPIRTSLQEEISAQCQWILKPEYSHIRWFDDLVVNEFADPDYQKKQTEILLQQMINFAVSNVPYYQELFEKLSLKPQDIRTIEDLPKIPILPQWTLLEKEEQLKAQKLPYGEELYGYFTSSGTTGRKKNVLMTKQNNLMFSLLAQRGYRLARFNPLGTIGKIRWSYRLNHLLATPLFNSDQVYELPRWQYAGSFFHTGKQISMNILLPQEQQLQYISALNINYLQTYSGNLEHLAFAYQKRDNLSSLKGFQAISEVLSKEAENRINKTFNLPIYLNYGLNEIGIVAMRCNAGRYHVHTEHCIVEIVDENNQPCHHGQQGKIMVTGLRNYAMPLFRYDTDDLAIALSDACPCGRTLPSFGRIFGRYKPSVNLPDYALHYYEKFFTNLDDIPDELIRNLRQYQIHLFKNNQWELRLVTAGDLPEQFYHLIRQKAEELESQFSLPPLVIKIVDRFDRSHNGKFQDFTSDFFSK